MNIEQGIGGIYDLVLLDIYLLQLEINKDYKQLKHFFIAILFQGVVFTRFNLFARNFYDVINNFITLTFIEKEGMRTKETKTDGREKKRKIWQRN